MNCRHCLKPLSVQLVDLGAAPPSNAFNDNQDAPERHYPLRVLVCMECGLAQTDITLFTLTHDELFTNQYPYYSSTSHDWVEHARLLVDRMTGELTLNADSVTVEIGCNDGYLLQWVKTPSYGIEPTQTGNKAKQKGIEVLPKFFNSVLASNLAYDYRQADWIVCNNVLAHVPDINDFVRGVAILLKPNGVATFEFPSLLNLIKQCQFDTIYHEHYSYLSLTAVANIFGHSGLHVFDVEKLPTHGGSLRIFAERSDGSRLPTDAVARALLDEWELTYPHFFSEFQRRCDQIKNDLSTFLLHAKAHGNSVAGFGAAAKANTLLNYAGIRADLLPYIVDETPSKQGKFCPGSRIPVRPNFASRPDYVVVFPWNFRDEIVAKLDYLREQGTHLVFAVPQLEMLTSRLFQSSKVAA